MSTSGVAGRAAKHDIAIIVFDGVMALDVFGPADVFTTATALGAEPGYRSTLVSVAGRPTRLANGLTVHTATEATACSPRTLVVPGSLDLQTPSTSRDLLGLVRRMAARSQRVAGVCAGALLLAEAGVLDGRRVTTHWAMTDALSRGYPDVEVLPDHIYVHDDDVWTSAGVTAGMDLALALVEQDHGSALAREVARWLVLYLRRAGGQSQYSAHLSADEARNDVIRSLLRDISEHPERDHSIPALARRAGLSERHLSRAFRSETGRTPADHVARIRLEAAQRLLETTTLPVAAVARRSGFGRPETLDRTFRRLLGTTPTAHRQSFSTSRAT